MQREPATTRSESPGSVLVIDDDPQVAALMCRVLEQEGYAAQLARDGRHGLQCLAERRFDLVLLDVFMPQVDGMEVLQAVRADYPQLPVVVVTGAPQHGLGDMHKVARLMGAADTLAKPFRLDRLREVVREAIQVE